MVKRSITSRNSQIEWKKIDPFAKPFGTVTRDEIKYKKDNLECFGVSELRLLLYTRLVTVQKRFALDFTFFFTTYRCSGKSFAGKKFSGKIEIEIKVEQTKGRLLYVIS